MEYQVFNKFEYKIISSKNVSASIFEKQLNELGQEGWEIFDKIDSYGTPRYIFKRKLECIKTDIS